MYLPVYHCIVIFRITWSQGLLYMVKYCIMRVSSQPYLIILYGTIRSTKNMYHGTLYCTDAYVLLWNVSFYILYVLIYRLACITTYVIHSYSHQYIKHKLHIAHTFIDIDINTWKLSRMEPFHF